MLGLTVVFFILAVVFSIALAHPTDSQSTAETWLFGAASSTLSALLGLFGGKVA